MLCVCCFGALQFSALAIKPHRSCKQYGAKIAGLGPHHAGSCEKWGTQWFTHICHSNWIEKLPHQRAQRYSGGGVVPGVYPWQCLGVPGPCPCLPMGSGTCDTKILWHQKGGLRDGWEALVLLIYETADDGVFSWSYTLATHNGFRFVRYFFLKSFPPRGSNQWSVNQQKLAQSSLLLCLDGLWTLEWHPPVCVAFRLLQNKCSTPKSRTYPSLPKSSRYILRSFLDP